MRLTEQELNGIINGISGFITKTPAMLRLYGSRIDDTKKGGDVDLMLIAPSEIQTALKIRKHEILVAIKEHIGDRKIDLLICDFVSIEKDPFLDLIFPTSILLKTWH